MKELEYKIETKDGVMVGYGETVWHPMGMSDGMVIPWPQTIYIVSEDTLGNMVATFYTDLKKAYQIKDVCYHDKMKCLEFCKEESKKNLKNLENYINGNCLGCGQRL